MTDKDGPSPTDAGRRAWAAPRVRRLATSGAEEGGGSVSDALENPS